MSERRDNVRVNVALPLTLYRNLAPITAQTVDLSGGGFLARVPKVGVWVTETYDAELDLSCGTRIEAEVLALRRVAERLVSFSFVTISNADRERIVREVFRQYQIALSRGLRK